MTQGFNREGRTWLAFLAVLAIFAIGAMLFAHAQNVWVDETTQLSGITLPLGKLIAWLSGSFDPSFGVPPDRMPPVSYFIDMIGWRLWGNNELAFRLYHAVITAGGILTLMVALARHVSLRAALIAGLLLAISPKLIMTAVEIRAYPILLAISCAQIALLIAGDVASRPRRLALFILLGLLSGYTHFFGLVATSAYAAAAFIAARSIRAAVGMALSYVLLLICWTGLYPFISGASAISSTAPEHVVGFSDLANYLAQVIASNVIMVNPIVAGIYLASTGILIVIGIVWVARRLPVEGVAIRHDPAVMLLIALTAGIIVTVAASVLVASFDALASRYSIWMLPSVMTIIAIGADRALGAAGKATRIAGRVAFAALALSAITAQILFLNRADWFIHGPSHTLEAMVAKAKVTRCRRPHRRGLALGLFPAVSRPSGDVAAVAARTRRAIGHPHQTGWRCEWQSAATAVLNDRATLLVSRVDLRSYQDLRTVSP